MTDDFYPAQCIHRVRTRYQIQKAAVEIGTGIICIGFCALFVAVLIELGLRK